jgi:hypothetical protein
MNENAYSIKINKMNLPKPSGSPQKNGLRDDYGLGLAILDLVFRVYLCFDILQYPSLVKCTFLKTLFCRLPEFFFFLKEMHFSTESVK